MNQTVARTTMELDTPGHMEQKPIMISWLQWNNGFPVKTDSVRTWSANPLSRNVI